jgi:Flp pilus assembly protein TadD
MIRDVIRKARFLTSATLVVALLASNSSPAEVLHTAAYQLGMALQESVQKGEGSLFAKTFDRDAFLNRVLKPIKISDALQENLRTNLQSKISSDDIAEAVRKNGPNFTFVGVRLFDYEYQLLFRVVGPNNSLVYFAYPMGKSASGSITIVDVLCFAPPELMSENVRRGCLIAVANADKSAVEDWTAKQKDFVAAQQDWDEFAGQCQAGHYTAAEQAYGKLPTSLRNDPYILYQRARVATREDEPTFLSSAVTWQKERPKDPALQMLMAEFYLQRNRAAGAVAAYEKLNTQFDGDPHLDIRIAKLQASLGHISEARTNLCQAINRDPPDTIAYAELLNWNLLERNFEEAARVLTLQGKLFHADLTPAVRSDDRFREFRGSAPGKKWLDDSAAIVIRSPSETLKLQAILFGTATPSALINGKTLFVQDKIGSYQVIKIEPQKVTLRSRGGDTRMLALGAGP